jgi:hypothetical protein
VAKKAQKEEEEELTNHDWGKIHAMAWRGEKVQVRDERGVEVDTDFKELLERDPTAAIRAYAEKEYNVNRRRLNLNKIIRLRAAPDPEDVPQEFWDDVNPFPPSCC